MHKTFLRFVGTFVVVEVVTVIVVIMVVIVSCTVGLVNIDGLIAEEVELVGVYRC